MSKRRLTCGVAIVLVVGLAARAAEDESWVGKHVLGKRPDLALKVGETFGAKVADLPQPMRVEREEGHWLWIDFAGKAGWLKKSDVVPFDQAVDYFSEVIQREPRGAWAYNLRGLVRERQGELQAAVRDFTEALRFDPQLAVAYNNRGIALDRNGEPKRAIEDYREALKLDPNYAAAYNNRGLAWSSLGDDKQAIADFDRAIRLDPKFAAARNNRGVAWDKTGDLARAEQDFTAAIGIDPTLAEAYGNRGNISRRQG
ncbi:MAG TPA: tetratricopeptide repeat protein, partial [Pirellulales bacterium]|nr:tetratricopeptide repeat protein [Pirellulales bacterium]